MITIGVRGSIKFEDVVKAFNQNYQLRLEKETLCLSETRI
ncbi:unnamed protein product [Paramecium octaurelia]|uniref:Uncharacterized protein n=1 Tax=Paramecium octaurelia TaxID=43137 RepID=A0A8S1WXM0_PAROT|nr:unnamed protein product [Paramecium octaurelia]